VCCTLRDGLGAALLELAKRDQPPAHVLLATSGMALPERVASQLQLRGLALARVLLVVVWSASRRCGKAAGWASW
jgi:G3E family GTPase